MDGEIRLIELPPGTLADLRNYVGSVAASADGKTVAVSSPEGDLLVAVDGAGFVATSGEGEMIGIAGAEREARRFDFRFDNHMLRVG